MATAPKAAKIDDVKRPEKVTPSATGRPIIVTNHPVLTNDPMMAPAASEEKPADTSGEVLSHTGKTIAPLESAPKVAEEAGQATEASKAAPEPVSEEKSTEPKLDPSAHEAAPSLPAENADKNNDPDRDPDAAQTAEEAAAAEAKAKRDAELEETIASGKYAVPINAVQRHRSQVTMLLLCMLALVLLLALADAVADIGLVNTPSSVPHTHLFSKN